MNGTAYNGSAFGSPQPESAIQYYRASSVVLTVDGYNDTSASSTNPSLPDIPLPTTIDSHLLECLNSTIGLAVPLVDSGDGGVSTIDKVVIVVPVIVVSFLILAIIFICQCQRAKKKKFEAQAARVNEIEYHYKLGKFSTGTHTYQPVSTSVI